ncbi:conjugal transfer protein TraF [Aquisalimonas sp. APHAB1-3]
MKHIRVRVPVIPVLAVALAAPAGASAANTAHIPVGQDISYGGVSHPRTVQATGNNPASSVASDRRGVWFGLGAFSLGYEVGDVDDLIDEAEDLEAALDRTDLTLGDAEDRKQRFDAFLVDAGQDGYFKLDGAAKAPFTPLGVNVPGVGGGAFSLDATAYGSVRGSLLDAPIEVQPTPDGDFELQSRTSGYLKGAAGVGMSVGYGGGVYHASSGSLFVGGRLNYYRMELAKGVIAFEDTDGDDNLADDLEDDFDRNRETQSAVGLDLGAIWTADNYRAGAILRNVNEPEFDYPEIGRNCDDPSLSDTANRNCYTAASFGDRISLSETYTMDRQLQLEGAVFTHNQDWHVSLAYDVNSSRDPVGDAYQWLSVSTGYAGSGWLLPGFRLGYRENLTGSELSYITGGLTFFRVLNLDAAVATDSVDVDGDEVPRSAQVSASLELYF